MNESGPRGEEPPSLIHASRRRFPVRDLVGMHEEPTPGVSLAALEAASPASCSGITRRHSMEPQRRWLRPRPGVSQGSARPSRRQ